MSSRFQTRLVTALLLLLAAFGPGVSSGGAMRLSLAYTAIYAYEKESRPPRAVAEQRAAAKAVTAPALLLIAEFQRQIPIRLFHRWRFQRPPPQSLLVPA